MKSIDLRNKMWIYSSILFMGALLTVTLSVVGFYGLKMKKIAIDQSVKLKDNISIAAKEKQIKELQSQNQSLQQEITLLKSKAAKKH